MTDKKGNTEATVMGLPKVADQGSVDTTAPALPPVPAAISPVVTAPPRTKTGGVRRPETIHDAPRSKSSAEVPAQPRTRTAGAVPKAPEAPRRASRVAVSIPVDVPSTAPNQNAVPSKLLVERESIPGLPPESDLVPAVETAVTSPRSKPVGPRIEWTIQKVAGVTAGVCLVFILLWVFWPSRAAKKQVAARPSEPEQIVDEAPKPVAKPKPAVVATPKPSAPANPTWTLDSAKHVVDPYGVHLDDQPLDPAHKYKLTIQRDDSRLGIALARLDEKNGWGVMRRMASHAALQFGGAKALRMHCEPGKQFSEGQLFPLELTDLATKRSVPIKLDPARHCWNFEVMRLMELGEGVKKRVRVPTDSAVKLGERVSLKVVYVLETLGEKKEWRTGTLAPGESVLAEGRSIRFGILDPYAADNEGSVELELLSGDTESSGLVTPTTETGVKFVPSNK